MNKFKKHPDVDRSQGSWARKRKYLLVTTLVVLIASASCHRLEGQGTESATVPAKQNASTSAKKSTPIKQPVPVLAQAGTGFDGRRAYSYLRQICSFGNRMSGSTGMRKQQQLLEQHFTNLGGQVEYQQFAGKVDPRTGQQVPMANMIVRWNPKAAERILLCAHYDTRPLPDRDPNPRFAQSGIFLGANDGASGVAVLMEMANHFTDLPTRYGIDLVFFDAEEFIYDERRDKFFLGSTWFAREYRNNQRNYEYVAGVLLDMVGDAKLTVYQERFSATWSDTRPIVKEIWDVAARLGVKEFIPRIGYEVRDDHVPLHQIGKIPICDVIDFQYPDRRNSYWHTTQDAPGRCSADSLGKVGLVILEWLRTKP